MGEILSIAVLNSRVKYNQCEAFRPQHTEILRLDFARGRIGSCMHWGVDPTSHAPKVIRVIRPKLTWLFPADENIWL